jgi:hypothetical protein
MQGQRNAADNYRQRNNPENSIGQGGGQTPPAQQIQTVAPQQITGWGQGQMAPQQASEVAMSPNQPGTAAPGTVFQQAGTSGAVPINTGPHALGALGTHSGQGKEDATVPLSAYPEGTPVSQVINPDTGEYSYVDESAPAADHRVPAVAGYVGTGADGAPSAQSPNAGANSDADYAASMKAFMDQLNSMSAPQLDPTKAVQADQQRRAAQGGMDMMAQANLAARTGASPDAQMGQQFQAAHTQSVDSADSAAKIQLQTQAQNMQAQQQMYSQKAAALMQQMAFAHDDKSRAAMNAQAITMMQMANQAQMAMADYQHQLQSSVGWNSVLPMLGGIGGTVVGGLLGGPVGAGIGGALGGSLGGSGSGGYANSVNQYTNYGAYNPATGNYDPGTYKPYGY